MHEAGRAEVTERLTTVEGAVAVGVVGPAWSGRTATLDEAATIAERRDRAVHRIDGGRPGALDPGAIDPAGAAILVDDAHLLDDSVLAALEAIVVDRDTTDTWIVATQASGVLPPALASLRQHFDAVVELAPLELDEVLRVHPLPETAEPLYAWSGGWAGLIAAFDSDAEAGAVPGSLAIAVETRLAMLDAEARAVVTALAFGASADDESLALLSAAADTDGALGRAAATLTAHDRLAPVIAAAVRAATEPAARRRMVDALLGLDRVDPVIEQVATWVAQHGERSTTAGRLYQRCGVACAADRPVDADRWLRLAVECGVGEAALDQARAALGAGEPRAALDQLATVDDDSRLELMGHAFAHLGRRREAERWFRRAGSPYVDLVALDPPTPDSWRVDPVIEPHALGLRRWAQGDAMGALDSLREAMREAEQLEPVRLRPDSPHAGAALAAVAVLDRTEAEEALRRADEARVGGAALARRHETLRAWVALRSGRWDEAEALLKNVDPNRLAPRDALVHRTTSAGLAVRANRFDELGELLVDIARLLADVELTTLDLPTLAEAAVAASRTHDANLTHQMLGLIDRCGAEPSDAPLHRFHAVWARLLVAMATNAPDDGVEAADELARLDLDDARLRCCVEAAQVFADTCRGVVDPDRVTTAASALEEIGLTHEAARLLGAAALRSREEGATRDLLKASRTLRSSRRRVGQSDVGVLSDRELEVAREVVAGRTHKEVGAALFISAKTVEHHVAKIRQKLGAANRAEMLASLHAYLDEV